MITRFLIICITLLGAGIAGYSMQANEEIETEPISAILIFIILAINIKKRSVKA